MTAIGKVLALLNLIVGLGIMAWSTTVYVHRPAWFLKPAVGERNDRAFMFEQLKADALALTRTAGYASQSWGANLKALEDREKVRADRTAAYAERLRWAHKGNPKDLVEPGNPKSAGKGFYEPVIDPLTNLHDLAPGVAPKGKAVVGVDGKALPGLDGLLGTLTGDSNRIVDLTEQIGEQQKAFDKLSAEVLATESRAIRMGTIRDSVQAELFYLSTFEVDVYETRETVLRRVRQLRARLKELGVENP
jgi:hypothetical protein